LEALGKDLVVSADLKGFTINSGKVVEVVGREWEIFLTNSKNSSAAKEEAKKADKEAVKLHPKAKTFY